MAMDVSVGIRVAWGGEEGGESSDDSIAHRFGKETPPGGPPGGPIPEGKTMYNSPRALKETFINLGLWKVPKYHKTWELFNEHIN